MAFDVINVLVDVLAAAVELGRVDLDDQGFAAAGRQGHAGREGHPVVGVDQVEYFAFSQVDHAVGKMLHFRVDVGAVIGVPVRFLGLFVMGGFQGTRGQCRGRLGCR